LTSTITCMNREKELRKALINRTETAIEVGTVFEQDYRSKLENTVQPLLLL